MTRDSLKDLEKRLDALESETSLGGDYPIVSLADLLAAAEDDALEVAAEDRRLFRVDGHVQEVPQQTLEMLENLAGDE